MIKTNQYLGVPYVRHGRTMDGADCVGIVLIVLADNGINAAATEQYTRAHRDMKAFADFWEKSATVQPLDVVAFENRDGIVNHIGVMIDDTHFLHSTLNAGVVISALSDVGRMHRSVAGIYRYKAEK